jgi:DMSO/TMAO reductase YedYZ molybdopterin-dependent catalytic subunit
MPAADPDKNQPDKVVSPGEVLEGIIVSADTRRAQRIPPGQSRTRKWPVLDASGPPKIDIERWEFKIWGLVEKPLKLSWKEFANLPRVKVFGDFHCVTRWSRLGNIWEGVAARTLVEAAGGLKQDATHVLAYGYDYGWTTNLSVEDFLAEDALVAIEHDGEPLAIQHGGPARLIVPRLYAWKSAKWLGGLQFLDKDEPGFWERNGYHMRGDPWKEERYGGSS